VDAKLQNDLREEVSTAGDPTFDEMHNGYPLLDAVIREVLRLHPPILENHHEVGLIFFGILILYFFDDSRR